MKYSKLIGKSLMNPPKDSDSRNAELLVQAGFVRKTAAGVFSYLPLGKMVLKKIEAIIHEEMASVDGQEVSLPALVPVESWEKTDRHLTDIGFKTIGANDREFILGWSHEEVITPLMKEFIESYRDLPYSGYQIQTKFRNEARAKSGVLRGREFTMKDMYSFHTSQEDLEVYYEKVKAAYLRVFERCNLKAYVVKASGGDFSDKLSHEFAVVTDAGEDTIIVNEDTGEAENMEVAGAYMAKRNEGEEELEIGKIKVDRGLTVKENAEAHGVPEWKILKTVVYKIENGFVGIVIRGDLRISMDRIKKYFGNDNIRTATDDELKELGLVKGFISPVANEKIEFIGDEALSTVVNYVTGANEEGQDLVGVNLGRDFSVKDFAHFADLTSEMLSGTDGEVSVYKAIEVGNIFQLDSFYSDAFDVKFTDADGEKKSVIMGCYGIGVTRLLGTIAEIHNDDKGLIWPNSVTPYHVHLLDLGDDEDVKKAASELYEKLKSIGYSVLYDDRNERAGKKFNDADLIGVPVRVLVSARNLKENVFEVKVRSDENAENIGMDDLLKKLENYYE